MKNEKIITLLLAVMFVLSVSACAAQPKSEPGSSTASENNVSQSTVSKSESEDDGYPVNGNIVYFKDTLNWGSGGQKIYVFYWSKNDSNMTVWPGKEMKNLGNNVYSYELPDNVEFIIFDNHSSGMSKEGQTRDIPYDGTVRKFQASEKQDEMKAHYVADWSGKEIGSNQIDDGSGANQLIVNVDGLKNIEDNDKFGVRVISSTIKSGYYSDNESADAFVFTVKNETDKTLSKVNLFILAYNPDEHARIIDLGPAVDLGLGDDAYIQEYESKDDLNLKPGATTDIYIQSSKKTISDFRGIISSYISDGKEAKNPTAYEWYKNAYTNKVVDNSKIFDRLSSFFGDNFIEGVKKDDRGAVSLDATVLFDFDSSELSDKGKKQLKEVIDAYVKSVSTEDGTILIKKITVEGHTDTEGTHEYNQKLSEDRANAVLNYCVEIHPELKDIMVAKGCADDNPVKKSDGSVDMEASRRVCFVAE